MADEAALAKAKALYQAKTLYAQKSGAANMNGDGFPGAGDGGAPDGPTEASTVDTALHAGKVGLGATAKALDVARGATTGPLEALALKMATGKDVASMKDWGNSVNPTNLNTFPSSSEMMDRAGVPSGAKLSDFAHVYGPAGKTPWYLPEEGGMLDPTVRGAGGFALDTAIDPLTYLSLGASAAGKKAVGSASKAVFEQAAKQGLKEKLIQLAAKPGEALAPLASKIAESRVGNAVSKMATAPSRAMGDVGDKMYRSLILPIEHEGARYGKGDVAQTLYDAGVKSPIGIDKKAGEAANTLGGAADKMMADSEAAGAHLDMNSAMQGAKDLAADIRAKGHPEKQWIADQLEKKVAAHEEMLGGKAATPDVTKQVPSGKLDWKGDPIMESKTIPGTPAVEPRKIGAAEGAELKTDQWAPSGDAQWNELRKTPQGAVISNTVGGGLKKEVENTVERGLGPGAGADLAQINAERGKLLSTRRSQNRVTQQAGREMNNLTHITPTDTIIAALETMGDGPGFKGIAAKHALGAARMSTMPVGYGLKAAAGHSATAALMDAATRYKLKKLLGYGSEEMPNGEEGK